MTVSNNMFSSDPPLWKGVTSKPNNKLRVVPMNKPTLLMGYLLEEGPPRPFEKILNDFGVDGSVRLYAVLAMPSGIPIANLYLADTGDGFIPLYQNTVTLKRVPFGSMDPLSAQLAKMMSAIHYGHENTEAIEGQPKPPPH